MLGQHQAAAASSYAGQQQQIAALAAELEEKKAHHADVVAQLKRIQQEAQARAMMGDRATGEMQQMMVALKEQLREAVAAQQKAYAELQEAKRNTAPGIMPTLPKGEVSVTNKKDLEDLIATAVAKMQSASSSNPVSELEQALKMAVRAATEDELPRGTKLRIVSVNPR